MNPSPHSFMKNLGPHSLMDMNPEQIKEMISKLEIIPCPEYDGIMWPSFMPFRIKGAEKAIKEIMAFPSRESDIMICTHGKSGTHWIYEIIQMLVNKTAELEKSAKSNTMLEALPDVSIIESLPSPRIIDTHFQFQYLPQKHIENRCKIVHMMRNPKDVMVSLYHHAKKDKMLDLNIGWNEFFEVWMDGKIPYGTWYDYELGMEQAEQDYPGMIFTCYYEDMKRNPEKDIERLAEFLGFQCNAQMIKDIAKATGFENMQKNKFDITSLIHGKGFIYRKGEIGDWKNHFTVAQNERFDAQYKEKMKGSKYSFTFE